MNSMEPKKLALMRIMQIFEEKSDYDHPLTQKDISDYLENDYGIIIERKAIGRDISLLKEAGVDIESKRTGSYLNSRKFTESELRMMIDSILSSKYITANKSKELIGKLCSLTSMYFKSHVKYIHSVDDWNKTENKALFRNIKLIDNAIEDGKQIRYTYNKYGADKKLQKSSTQVVSPYQMFLHNQRYYLMAYSEYWGNMVYHRLDHISDMSIEDTKAVPLSTLKDYENGINYKEISTQFPYMFSDKPERVEFLADNVIIDQIIDWFGTDVRILKEGEDKVRVSLLTSKNAFKYWALQYLNYVEVTSPKELREQITADVNKAAVKYSK